MVLAAKLNAELKANKASMVTNHDRALTMPACTARGHSSARKWGNVPERKGRGQMFHEKNIIRLAGTRFTFDKN